jgi:hypothetical protein
VDVDLKLPEYDRLSRIFLNANWAHLIDPRRYEPSSYRGTTQIPAARYNSGDEQNGALNKVASKILSTLHNFDRSHLTAIEWSINEITDNVLNHAMSPVGGFLQANFAARRPIVEFFVCDAGIGIPNSLRGEHPEIHSDHEALDRAIREGVTRNVHVGQGNGLYGSWRITQLSGGSFEIHSGYASLISYHDKLHIRPEAIPFIGTLVAASINYEEPLSLGQALKFRGKSHEPADMVQITYEETEDGSLYVQLSKEGEGFGSRVAGVPIRNKLKNLIRIGANKKIIVDFDDVPVISSSYADEVFGKLFVELGALTFMKAIEFRRVDETVRALIDKAIEQRAKTGL